MSEITSAGYTRRNRPEIREDIENRFKTLFGANINTGDDSVFGKIIDSITELQLERENLEEEIVATRSISGAEGVYLDDIASRFGVFRRGKIAGSGVAHVRYNNTTPSGTSIPTTSEFTAANGIKYAPNAITDLDTNWDGLVLKKADLSTGNYDFAILNTETAILEEATFAVLSLSDVDVLAFLNDVKDFILNNTSDNDSLVFVDTTNVVLYAGYSSSTNFTGLSERTTFTMDPFVGEFWSGVDVTAKTTGFYPVGVGEINSLTPSFTGLVATSNGKVFSSGSEVETDAELRIRIQGVSSASPKGSINEIIGALFEVENVSDVRIYNNPTEVDLTIVDPDGGPDFTVAGPFTFTPVVYGGLGTDIIATLFANKPINTLTDGETSVTVTASDGLTEVVKYTAAVERPLSVRITYVPSTGVSLSTGERNAIVAALQEAFSSARIGGTLFNTQLISAVLRSVPYDRVTTVTVEVKDEADLDVEYSSADFQVNYKQVATLDPAEVVFVKSV